MSDAHPPVRAGDHVSLAQITRIFEGLQECSLPKEEWTHQAHLISAVALLETYGLDGAEARMPDLIRNYNVATGGVNSDTEGYHHTITLFYLRQIEEFLYAQSSVSLAEKVNQLLASSLAEPTYPLRFYSKDYLFTVEARREWAPPDLTGDGEA